MNNTPHLQQTTNDSQATFAQIVDQWQGMVYNTALSMVQNHEDAEDITQEVFIDVFENLSGFKQQATLKTWIYRITVNKTLDWLKKKKRQKHGGLLKRVFLIKDQDEPISFYHPGAALDNKENAAALFKALKQLPTKQQAVFTLHKMEGLPYAEIAGIMNTTVNAVEALMMRAKNELRKILETHYMHQNG